LNIYAQTGDRPRRALGRALTGVSRALPAKKEDADTDAIYFLNYTADFPGSNARKLLARREAVCYIA
jgi:hypothetical protein